MVGPNLRTIAVINQKGGCGKTTTSINLAAALAQLGRRTLLIDMDPQGHCALGLAVPEAQVERSIADALLAPHPVTFDWPSIIWQVSANLDLAPSNTRLAVVEHQLTAAPDRDLRLAKALARLNQRYEFCIIDCPPSIGLLTFNALRAAREVIIPVETGYFALHGAMKQAATLQVLADRAGHEVAFSVLPTMYDTQTELPEQIVAELRKHFGDRVLDILIHYHVELKKAAVLGQPVSEFDPESRAASDFRRLAEFLLANEPTTGRIASSAAAAAIVERATRSFSQEPPVIQAAGLEALIGVGTTAGAPQVVPAGVEVASANTVGPVPPGVATARGGGDRLTDLLQRAKAIGRQGDRSHQSQSVRDQRSEVSPIPSDV